MSKSVTNVQELGGLANSLTKVYCSLSSECGGAVAACSDSQVGLRVCDFLLFNLVSVPERLENIL